MLFYQGSFLPVKVEQSEGSYKGKHYIQSEFTLFMSFKKSILNLSGKEEA